MHCIVVKVSVLDVVILNNGKVVKLRIKANITNDPVLFKNCTSFFYIYYIYLLIAESSNYIIPPKESYKKTIGGKISLKWSLKLDEGSESIHIKCGRSNDSVGPRNGDFNSI